MIFLSDLNHDLNQRFKSNDLNHNNPDIKYIKCALINRCHIRDKLSRTGHPSFL